MGMASPSKMSLLASRLTHLEKGGSAIYSGEAFTSAIVEAGDRFTNTVTDPKAEMILTFVVVGTKVSDISFTLTISIVHVLFWD